MEIETIYESFFDTYRNMGYMISELSRQTLKTAAVEAERRAKESDTIANMRTSSGSPDEMHTRSARNAKVKRRQAEKFRKKLYIKSGGTARADAVPDYKSGAQEDRMDAAALKRHPHRPRKKLGSENPGYYSGPKNPKAQPRASADTTSAAGPRKIKDTYGKEELERQTKRYK